VSHELRVEYEIEKLSDINDIINFGVMMTPGLVIDEEVKSVVGRRHKKILK
jgi:hypothetical protein